MQAKKIKHMYSTANMASAMPAPQAICKPSGSKFGETGWGSLFYALFHVIREINRADLLFSLLVDLSAVPLPRHCEGTALNSESDKIKEPYPYSLRDHNQKS